MKLCVQYSLSGRIDAGMTQRAPCSMWAFLRLKDTVVKSILDEAATLEHPQQRVRDNLLLPFSTLATWVIFGVSSCAGILLFLHRTLLSSEGRCKCLLKVQ